MSNLSIIGVDVKDFKRVELVNLRFDKSAGLITIGGQNANGKSSVIDAMYTALVGVPRSLQNPVRDGADEAQIRVLIGNGDEVAYKVIRTFSNGRPTKLSIIAADGQSPRDASTLLKELLGTNGVDPLAFINMEPRAQRDVLAKLVGLDISQFDHAIAESREHLRTLERAQAQAEARVSELPWYDDAPEAELSAENIINEISAINDHNNERVKIESRAEQIGNEICFIQRQIANNSDAQDQIKQQIEALRSKLIVLAAEKGKFESELSLKQIDLDKAQSAVKQFQPQDPAPLLEKLNLVEATNAKVRANRARIAAAELWQSAENETAAQLAKIKQLESEKRTALASAKFPVDGLSFDQNQILFNGQPFAQCSDAERIRVATSILIAMRGRVCAIFIRQASLLDNESMAVVAELAEHHGAQVFAEVVANRKDNGFDRDCDIYMVEGLQEVNA